MSSHLLEDVFIIAAKRTPFGSFGGKLKNQTATDICVQSSKAVLAAANIDPNVVDSVYVGNVAHTSVDAAYISRHVQLRSGIPIEKTALSVNRLCGSGFQSVISGAQEIQLGEANVALCGGAENMSQSPYAVYGQHARFGISLGSGLQLQDTLWLALTDTYSNTAMGVTAENLAEKYGVTREECDSFALRSQTLWGEANKAGHFEAELQPVDLSIRKSGEADKLVADESPRSTSLEKLAKLKPVFKKNGIVTAGNSSGISDGAGSLLLASKDAVDQHNLKPIARLIGYHVAGVEPSIMGYGPVPAIKALLKKTGLTIGNIDMFEINEAFAAQALVCIRDLDIDLKLVNQSGGAIAIGHPLGASGARITTHLVHSLQRTGKKYAIGSACIGGGQGIALLIENVA
uniref:3ketoacylCoA thiolase putative n=1 Tax=Albugo laibachii Nc14 TaxID=890382 RepID=F0WTG3_9STRA|nr:3ketoacylCoA thiolase putative [Albugo laibachii Nc14]|eukprot:CCA24653.1 3ketoacylCoA thiolase putative [Albugo laibachii Nc14]